MEFYIREGREEDAASIVELLNPIIQAGKYTVMDKLITVHEQIEFIRGLPERGIFHVAVSGDNQRIVGIQDVVPFSTGSNAFRHVGEIGTFVSLDSLRCGIGRRLCHATFLEAKKQGFLKISAMIRADNPRAVSFYVSQGFKIIGTAQKHALVRGKYIDEILAERFI